MRKILLLTLAFVFAGVSVAGATKINVGDATNPPSILDIRLQEGFENGGAIPAGWTDSPGANPWLYGDGTYWNQDWSPGAPHSGSYTAYFPFWDTPSGIADSLMTPSMDLSGGAGQFVLRYWSWYPNSYASDSVVVYLKEGDVLNRIHKMPVSDLNPFLIPWTQNIVPFNTLSNDAKIVFVMYTGDWGYGMTIPYIDDIKVYDAPITARCCYGDVHAPSCADNSLAECNALGGTWEPYLSCEEDPCPATPANDQCSEAQAIVGPYPQTITGTNINATVDCPGFLDDGWNGVWYTIELPYASNHLTIDFSPTCALIDSLGVDRIGNAWMPNCDCTERHEFDNLEWGYCYPAWDNFYTYYYPVLSAVIEGPTTIYFPCNVGQTPRDFAFTVDVKNYVPPTPDFQITAARGTWVDPSQTTCGAGNDCPWHPSEDQLWEITIPYDDSVWIFSLCNTAQNWNAQNQVNGMGSRMMIGTSPCDGGIAENEGACDGLSQFSANLNAGTYYLTIEGSHPGDCGYYQLDIDIAPPPPPNDNCENVIPSELAIGSTVTFTGDNTNATNDCENDSYNQVWEAFTTTELANIAIDYCGTPPYTDDDSPGFRLSRINSYIFSGCPCGDRYFRASGDDAICPDGMRTNYFNFLPAGTYYIPIRYRDPQARGPYTINVTATAVPPAPENNDCANAQAIGDVTDLVFNTTTATYDGSGDCIFSPNIWYLYTASATGRIKAALCGSSYDTKLAVWSGSDCATSTIVGCNDDSCEVGSIVVFDAVVGSQYLIEVGGSGPSYGEGLLTVGPLPAACNYVVGDCNNSGGFNGVDVVYAVSYFKGGSAPEYTCECTPGNSWYVAGDVNASCNFNGVDVTYAVSYFKGGLPPHPCADCPPPGFLKVGDKGAPSSLPSDNNGAN